ncbi:MAG TPA: LysM peptidoglycan-binding domain-containing protein [Nevskiaceae bacterium]|nr:LysM peptidoglycan-binding domain-containing protein [Nevskiaceae bacterium]
MRKFNRFGAGLRGPRWLARGWSVMGLVAVLAACSSSPVRVPPKAPKTPATAPTVVTHPLAPVIDLGRARAAAPRLGLRQGAPLEYIVRRGDTLWGIASYFLKNPWQWPVLWYDNPQIKNPHLIYPGDVLKLVWVNGQPRLTLGNPGAGTERLEPHVRVEALAGATPAIPFSAIRTFLNGPRVVDSEQIDHAPYVLAFAGEHLVGSTGDSVFVKNLPPDAAAHWQIVHIGQAYRDPDNGELLGYEAIPTAHATLRKNGHPARLEITSNQRETLVGDRLLPRAAIDYRSDFVPHAPKHPVDGSIIAVFNGLDQIGQHAIVTLDRGTRAGLDAGAVLQILQASRSVPDPYGSVDSRVVIPPQPAGLMMVFEAGPRLSYALVMRVTQAVHVLDRFAVPGPASD